MSSQIQPLFGAGDQEWVTLVGRYILNLGAVEHATRLIIARIHGTDQCAVFNAELSSRLGYVRKRYPRTDRNRHEWAMSVFRVALLHVDFRNIIAHSPIVLSKSEDGPIRVVGILGLTPADPKKAGEVVSIEELRGRVNESAAIARDLLAMQEHFASGTGV